ncbi:MAG: regulatory protein RecX [Frankiales bacterium]|nr:regulatory protein RecX [Frankiales bacterium]
MAGRDLSERQRVIAPSRSDTSERDADPESVARAIALRMLERQPRTRAELARGMARRGVPADAAAAVLDRFTEVGLIDDEAFAAAWVDSRHAGRGLGRRALSAELRRRGVDDSVVRETVATVSDEDEAAAARALVRRKLATMQRLPRETQLRRLVAMLARKGFGQGLAMQVVREAVAGAEAEAD